MRGVKGQSPLAAPDSRLTVHRCREQEDQCCYADGTRCRDAIALRVPDRWVWQCQVCGREYSPDRAFAYAETVPS